MHLSPTALPGVSIITSDIFPDARGYFCERYSQPKLAALGFHARFVQDNLSRSLPGVIRGLHFQHTPPQGKLVGVTRGRILDVAVDLRPASPWFKKHVAVELSDENGHMLWIPPGFGHGFCVLGDAPADVFYKVTAAYAADGEAGIRHDDPALGIGWPVRQPILSARDAALPTLTELAGDLSRWFGDMHD